MMGLTPWYYYPYKVHEKVVTPKVVRFWPAVCNAFVILFRHARFVVEDITINLIKGYHSLKRMVLRMLSSDKPCHSEGERAPTDLRSRVLVFFFQRQPVKKSVEDLRQLQSPYTARTGPRSSIWNLTWRIPFTAAQTDPAC